MTLKGSIQNLEVEKVLQLFSVNGPIHSELGNFEIRSEQLEMVKDIVEAYNENKIALVEAGTGTGKSLAYLVPALLWALKNNQTTVISTNTINLQEQLLFKEIPFLAKVLKINIKAVLVKGMSNYVCLRKVKETQHEISLFPSEEQVELQKIAAWSDQTKDGSRADLPFVPQQNSWEKVCAEGDLCLREKCEFYNQCHFFNARKQAKDAQILISNHSLLFSDLAVRSISEKGLGILPDYDKVILDEAHNIEEIATDHFASKTSMLYILRVLSRLYSEKQGKGYGKIALLYRVILRAYGHNLSPDVEALLSKMNLEIPHLRRQIGQLTSDVFSSFAEFIQLIHPSQDQPADGIIVKENKLRLLSNHQKHPAWLEEIFPQTKELITQLRKFIQILHSLDGDITNLKDKKLKEDCESLLNEIIVLGSRLDKACTTLSGFIESEFPKEKVKWVETAKYRNTLHVELIDAKLDISGDLAHFLFRKFPTTILCSATLTTNNHFHFIKERLGLIPLLLQGKPLIEKIYTSPFNYKTQALLAIPMDLPSPSDSKFTEKAAETILLAIQASRGNAFVLFTSYTNMRYCHSLLALKLKEKGFTLLIQGEKSRKKLIEEFKEIDRSVLFGTDSFWEGVDVAGEALRCVIIVKLPFQVPKEPIIQARMEAISAKGGNPFLEFSVPNAIVKFKQGFGRLIRKKNDRGCIVCLDSRIKTQTYGKLFLNSLPNCQKHFVDSKSMHETMNAFYKDTYYLTKK